MKLNQIFIVFFFPFTCDNNNFSSELHLSNGLFWLRKKAKHCRNIALPKICLVGIQKQGYIQYVIICSLKSGVPFTFCFSLPLTFVLSIGKAIFIIIFVAKKIFCFRNQHAPLWPCSRVCPLTRNKSKLLAQCQWQALKSSPIGNNKEIQALFNLKWSPL